MPAPADTAPLDLRVDDIGTTREVTLHGDLDAAGAVVLRATLDEALASGAETVLVDLAQLTFIGSCGVHALCDAFARAEADGTRFVVLPGPPVVQLVFDLCGLAERLPFARVSAAEGA